jgi:glycerol-3-phosphate dehydrogenase (NAD(P)+)
MIAVAGAGAFGTALAISLASKGQEVLLWARDLAHVATMRNAAENARYLPGVSFPKSLRVTANAADLARSDALLLAVPMQSLAEFLAAHPQAVANQPLIACCKGVDLVTQQGPSAVIAAAHPAAPVGVLTGPSFAADIARGLPTALTFAYRGDNALMLQETLSTPVLRLYLSTDLIGAELGGALKNVIAIAAGVVIGAGLGASARAAIMTRGFVEMQRLAAALGAQAETLTGLSGFGDLVLTCASEQSRNFRFGLALGAGQDFAADVTVEGAATAHAVAKLAVQRGLDMPITQMIAALIAQKITLTQAVAALMSRPLKQE